MAATLVGMPSSFFLHLNPTSYNSRSGTDHGGISAQSWPPSPPNAHQVDVQAAKSIGKMGHSHHKLNHCSLNFSQITSPNQESQTLTSESLPTDSRWAPHCVCVSLNACATLLLPRVEPPPRPGLDPHGIVRAVTCAAPCKASGWGGAGEQACCGGAGEQACWGRRAGYEGGSEQAWCGGAVVEVAAWTRGA